MDFTESTPLQSRINTSIRDMLIYINEHYKESLSVAKLAGLIGYNANYLSRLKKIISTPENFTGEEISTIK